VSLSSRSGGQPDAPRYAKPVLIYGVCGGLLIVSLRLAEYRFLVVEHSIEIYVALIAALFAALGIWLGLSITRSRPVVAGPAVPPTTPPAPFVVDRARLEQLAITPRELEILQLMATGMSTREMAEALFVSENTVKTHASRIFDKLGVNKRMKAVHAAQAHGLLP